MSDLPSELPCLPPTYKEFNQNEKRRSPVQVSQIALPKDKRTKHDPFNQDFELAAQGTNTRKTFTIQLESGPLVIHNVLASARLLHDGKMPKLDLEYVANIFQDTYLKRSEFSATRINVPYQATIYAISVFENGRIQSTGGADPVVTEYVMKKIAKRLAVGLPNLIYEKCEFKNFEIQNILAVMDLGSLISLRTLIANVPGGADYEPEKFPAARFRLPVEGRFDAERCNDLARETETRMSEAQKLDTRSKTEKLREATRLSKDDKQEHVTINVFGTGKVTFTGARSIASMVYAWETLWPYVLKTLEMC